MDLLAQRMLELSHDWGSCFGAQTRMEIRNRCGFPFGKLNVFL